MDIAVWLHGLGLQQYEETFRDNAVDAAVLPELTAEDLKDLGVSLVGHRRKLLAAIAALQSDVSAPASAPAPLRTDSAERRQLTVMFCDLVGSTPLSSQLDPEDLLEVIAAYHHAVAKVVAESDGFIARYMGDGVLVYFGYPQAHEDDAERAVRAGLGAVHAVRRLDVKSVKLQARVGIATGLVVVGDRIGEGSAQEQSVVGETPNLAARLQTLAAPDTVVIAAATRRLVGDLFEYRDLGASKVKGIADPVPAWQVLRPSAVASRFEGVARLDAEPADRPRGGNRPAATVLGVRQSGQRSDRFDRWRSGSRQIASDRRVGGASPYRAASWSAQFLLALPPGQRAFSVCRPAQPSVEVCT